MNNREAYKFSKVLVRTLVKCDTTKEQYDLYKHYRVMLRKMVSNDLLSYVQRNYLVGAILKVTEYAGFYEGFNVPYLRKYK